MIDEMEQLEQLCAAVPSPDRQRLAAARARLSTAIGRETAGHTARRQRLARSLALRHRWLGRRWLGWAAPLAAAAAVTGVILGSQGAFSTLHHPAPSSSTHDPGLGVAHPATAYVAGQSGTVTRAQPRIVGAGARDRTVHRAEYTLAAQDHPGDRGRGGERRRPAQPAAAQRRGNGQPRPPGGVTGRFAADGRAELSPGGGEPLPIGRRHRRA